jgi:hypothetical protein
MATQTFLWICLPNGVSGNNLKFTAFVAPRLDPQLTGGADGTLANFSFGNWATRMQSLTMSVVADSHTTPIPATPDPTSAALDPNLWNIVFPAQTPVHPFKFTDYSAAGGVEIVSYSVIQLIEIIYRTVVTSIEVTPPRGRIPAYANGVQQWYDNLNGIETILIQFAQTTKITQGETATSILARMGVTLTALQRAIFDFQRFFNRYKLVLPPNAGPVDSPVPGWTDKAISPAAPTADFHSVVGMLADYPVMLRMLGLARDFTIPTSVLGSQTTGLRLVPSFTTPPGPAVTQNVTPRTQAKINLSTGYFRAADRGNGSIIADAMLLLDDPRFRVVQGQVDGTISKAVDAGTNELYRLNPSLPRFVPVNGVLQLQSDTGVEQCLPPAADTSLPAFRSGVQLVHDGRASVLQTTLTRQSQFNASPANAVLFSDDLVRGYRVDVFDRGNWRSLCQRTGTVTVTNGATEVVTLATPSQTAGDEGYVKAVSASKKDQFPFQLFVHETVFGWDGWSLAAPHPSLTVVDTLDKASATLPAGTHSAKVHNTNVDSTNTPQTFQFAVTSDIHALAGSLPRLRFGSTYQFRARAVDLAGNSLAVNAVPVNHPTAPFTYLRFEPVLSPAAVATERFTSGESLEHLVVRDGAGVSARFLVPPKASQLEVETHGMLDPLFAAKNFTGAFALSAKESGTFTDAAFFGGLGDANAVILTNDPNDGELAVKDQTSERGTALSPLSDPENGTPDPNGTPPGAYMVYRGAQLPLPYLPDPLATGIAVYVDPVTPTIQTFSGASFDTTTPIRFELHPGTGSSPVVAPGNANAPFTVSIPPATILDVDYTSTMSSSQLSLLAFWQMGGSAGQDPNKTANGNIPQLMGHRKLRLVHAVLQPLAPASLTSADLRKALADTFFTVASASLSSHSRSTGEIEVFVEWTETQDLLPATPRTRVARRALGFRTSVPYGSDAITLPFTPAATPFVTDQSSCEPFAQPNIRIDFGDTKARNVQFRCTAATRYGEYYDPTLISDPAQSTLVGSLSATFAVPSSAKPPKPDVAYVVPTFLWDTSSTTQHARTGGSVRIYLSRPWFASGDGELLGVVVANVSNGSVDAGDTVRPFVSEWGFDPLYQDTFSAPGQDNAFTTLTAGAIVSQGAIAPATVQLADLPAAQSGQPSTRVQVVGHPVSYTGQDRDLWFADVAFNTGNAHAPVVRLAVVRYQPNSLTDVEISPVVRIDCVQLASSRTAAVARSTTSTGTALNVTVTGPSASNFFGQSQNGNAPGPGVGHQVLVTVDIRPKGGADFEWVPQQNPAPVTLTATGPAVAGLTTWTGSIPNAPISDAMNDVRIRIEEFELFQGDGTTVGQRPVFVDTFFITI